MFSMFRNVLCLLDFSFLCEMKSLGFIVAKKQSTSKKELLFYAHNSLSNSMLIQQTLLSLDDAQPHLDPKVIQFSTGIIAIAYF